MISDGDSDSECKAIYESNSVTINDKVHIPTTRALKRKSSSITRGVHLGDQDDVLVSKRSHVSFRKIKKSIDHTKNDATNEEAKSFEKKIFFHKTVEYNSATEDISHDNYEGFDLNSYIPKNKAQTFPTTNTLKQNRMINGYTERRENYLEINSTNISINNHPIDDNKNKFTPNNKINKIANIQTHQNLNNKSFTNKGIQHQNQNNQEFKANGSFQSVIDHPAHWSSGKVPKLAKNRNNSRKSNTFNSLTSSSSFSSFSSTKTSIVKATDITTTFPSPAMNKRRDINALSVTKSTYPGSSCIGTPKLSFQPSWLTTPRATTTISGGTTISTNKASELSEDISNYYENEDKNNNHHSDSIDNIINNINYPNHAVVSPPPLSLHTIPKSPSSSTTAIISSHIPPPNLPLGLANQSNLNTTDYLNTSNFNIISTPHTIRNTTITSPPSSTEKTVGYNLQQSRNRPSKYSNKYSGKFAQIFHKISKSMDMDENRITSCNSIGLFPITSSTSNSNSNSNSNNISTGHLLDDIRDKSTHWIDVTVTDIRPYSQHTAFQSVTVYVHQITLTTKYTKYTGKGNDPFTSGNYTVSDSNTCRSSSSSIGIMDTNTIISKDSIHTEREEGGMIVPTGGKVTNYIPINNVDDESKNNSNKVPCYANAYFKSHLVQRQGQRGMLAVGVSLRIYDVMLLSNCTKVNDNVYNNNNSNNWDNSLPVIICTSLYEMYPSTLPPLITPTR